MTVINLRQDYDAKRLDFQVVPKDTADSKARVLTLDLAAKSAHSVALEFIGADNKTQTYHVSKNSLARLLAQTSPTTTEQTSDGLHTRALAVFNSQVKGSSNQPKTEARLRGITLLDHIRNSNFQNKVNLDPSKEHLDPTELEAAHLENLFDNAMQSFDQRGLCLPTKQARAHEAFSQINPDNRSSLIRDLKTVEHLINACELHGKLNSLHEEAATLIEDITKKKQTEKVSSYLLSKFVEEESSQTAQVEKHYAELATKLNKQTQSSINNLTDHGTEAINIEENFEVLNKSLDEFEENPKMMQELLEFLAEIDFSQIKDTALRAKFKSLKTYSDQYVKIVRPTGFAKITSVLTSKKDKQKSLNELYRQTHNLLVKKENRLFRNRSFSKVLFESETCPLFAKYHSVLEDRRQLQIKLDRIYAAQDSLAPLAKDIATTQDILAKEGVRKDKIERLNVVYKNISNIEKALSHIEKTTPSHLKKYLAEKNMDALKLTCEINNFYLYVLGIIGSKSIDQVLDENPKITLTLKAVLRKVTSSNEFIVAKRLLNLEVRDLIGKISGHTKKVESKPLEVKKEEIESEFEDDVVFMPPKPRTGGANIYSVINSPLDDFFDELILEEKSIANLSELKQANSLKTQRLIEALEAINVDLEKSKEIKSTSKTIRSTVDAKEKCSLKIESLLAELAAAHTRHFYKDDVIESLENNKLLDIETFKTYNDQNLEKLALAYNKALSEHEKSCSQIKILHEMLGPLAFLLQTIENKANEEDDVELMSHLEKELKNILSESASSMPNVFEDIGLNISSMTSALASKVISEVLIKAYDTKMIKKSILDTSKDEVSKFKSKLLYAFNHPYDETDIRKALENEKEEYEKANEKIKALARQNTVVIRSLSHSSKSDLIEAKKVILFYMFLLHLKNEDLLDTRHTIKSNVLNEIVKGYYPEVDCSLNETNEALLAKVRAAYNSLLINYISIESTGIIPLKIDDIENLLGIHTDRRAPAVDLDTSSDSGFGSDDERTSLHSELSESSVDSGVSSPKPNAHRSSFTSESSVDSGLAKEPSEEKFSILKALGFGVSSDRLDSYFNPEQLGL